MISIVVPIYNSEKTLEKCLNSILNQSMKNFEVLMINDGSTDGSKGICEEFSRVDSRFRLFNNVNRGVSYSRNFGIDNSLGSYIQFVDADDYLEKNITLKLYNQIISDKSDLVICGYKEILNGNSIACTNIENNLLLSLSEFNSIFSDLYVEKLLNVPWNKLYIKEKISFCFDEDISLGEDLLFNLQYFQNANKISIIKDILYNYVTETDKETLSSQFDFTNLNKIKELHKRVNEYLVINNVSNQNNFTKINLVLFNDVYEYLKKLSFLDNKKMKKKIILDSINDEVIINAMEETKVLNKRHKYLRMCILEKKVNRIIRYYYIDQFMKNILKK